MDGILPDEVMAGWRPTAGEHFLNPHEGEIVVFRNFIDGDLDFRRIHFCASFLFTMA